MIKYIVQTVLDYYYNLWYYTNYTSVVKSYNENYTYNDILNHCIVRNDYFKFNYRTFACARHNYIHSIHTNGYKFIVQLLNYNCLYDFYK